MFKSKKITVAAGVLGSLALIGLGAAQAVAVESTGRCADDGKGNVRCADVSEREITTERYGKIRLKNDMSQSCSGGGAKVSCGNSLVVEGKKL
ncbi:MULTISPECIES: hypothetical protein [unclassified Streptomyces]|jgi:hypothetical protein|uniref:hypothetical protein n=1 Tax=unclassified Streptomyces TaxID=2593676 RepID=UPI0036FDD219